MDSSNEILAKKIHDTRSGFFDIQSFPTEAAESISSTQLSLLLLCAIALLIFFLCKRKLRQKTTKENIPQDPLRSIVSLKDSNKETNSIEEIKNLSATLSQLIRNELESWIEFPFSKSSQKQCHQEIEDFLEKKEHTEEFQTALSSLTGLLAELEAISFAPASSDSSSKLLEQLKDSLESSIESIKILRQLPLHGKSSDTQEVR